ncbi:MAG: ABC-F family ATP-binding cassette domain-containing protein [Deltaproteobacteria bacterium]|nr:ABC-F family ATP-binding cassette domain-containing protein [Deltaproteobacteria bacterium]
MLHVRNLTYRVAGRTILDAASAQVDTGQRVGIVGSNGSGKTTLFRLIAGDLEPDEGEVRMRSRTRVGTVAQEAPGGQRTSLEAVLAADIERSDLLIEADTSKDPERIAEVHQRLADIEAHAAPAKAAAILAGLGFDEGMQRSSLSTLSGGWRMRVALAAVLFSEPDLLLLDEPTNHLDLESVVWLEEFLRCYPHTVLVVSHDRELLNSVAQRIVHLDRGKLTAYRGDYDAFERARYLREAGEEAARSRQQAERKRIQTFIDRVRADKKLARQAQSRIKLLERMAPIRAAAAKLAVAFKFPEPAARPSPLVKLDGATAGYAADRPVLTDLSLSVYRDDRIALLGQNGNGKTTLSRLLAGDLEPLGGEIVRAGKLRTGYFAQDQIERLDPEAKALELLARVRPDDSPEGVRTYLGRFGFPGERAEVRAGALSGGERTRLVLALIATAQPNLLILDEPTNHLDADARQALVDGLNEWTGSVVLVSHDRHLIEATADRLWLVADGTCCEYFGDVDEYRRQLLAQRQSRDRGPASKSHDDDRVSRKDQRRQAAEARARIAPLKKAAAEAEARMVRLTDERQGIDAELADPAIYENAGDRVAGLTRRQRELEREVAAAEEAWLEAQSALEDAHAAERDSG